jgi:hypothetical protein
MLVFPTRPIDNLPTFLNVVNITNLESVLIRKSKSRRQMPTVNSPSSYRG